MSEAARTPDIPWYRRAMRWGQTNLTEIDPARYDHDWWREHWRRTRVQGVIVNAGGIVAYYPSRYPLQHRAEFLAGRDLYGEIVEAARKEGLAVIARMDSNRAHERFYLEHPDWFTVDSAGRPHRAGELYVSCVNSAYYDAYLPTVLEEIIERSSPDGFADNSWSGLPREHICFCGNCRRSFKKRTGNALPERADWDDPVYRQWIRWNYDRRTEIWELNNRVTRAAGGEHCLWLGMNGGDVAAQSSRFRDHKAICERSPVFMLDFQGRREAGTFQGNADAGRRLHGLLGWDTLIPESTALYGMGNPTFRLGSKPEPEVRLWALEGFAAGIQPWWHHIGSVHDDRRQYRTAEPLFTWHERNQEYLVGRTPVATVGVVWSQENGDFYGRDEPGDRVTAPYRGVVDALLRARIPYLPVHADHVDRDADLFEVLVLPNVGALSDEQCAAIRRFVSAGGGLFATGESSAYDETGRERGDFALADLLGAHATGRHHGSAGRADPDWETWGQHSYLRVRQEAAASAEPAKAVTGAARHPVLSGLEEAGILPFAGRLDVVRPDPDAGAEVLLTLVPPFPIFPPETSWMRHPTSDVPALLLSEGAEPGRGRVAYSPADVDRCFYRDGHPDHATLIAGLVRWAARDRIPLRVTGAGTVDCSLYEQAGADRLVLHLVNLTATGRSQAPVHEFVPVGPLSVEVAAGVAAGRTRARSLVTGDTLDTVAGADGVSFTVPRVRDHEVIVLERESPARGAKGVRE